MAGCVMNTERLFKMERGGSDFNCDTVNRWRGRNGHVYLMLKCSCKLPDVIIDHMDIGIRAGTGPHLMGQRHYLRTRMSGDKMGMADVEVG